MTRLIAFALCLLLIGCDDGGGTDAGAPDAGAADAGTDAGPPVPFGLTSEAFMDGEAVPTPHLCGPPLAPGMPGMNISPALSWTAGPPETMSYAVVIRDLSAGGLVHWVIYDIPASVTELPENVTPGYEPGTPAGAKQAEIQGSGYFGYFGPCSGGRMNNYQWTLHALDTATVQGVTMATDENTLATTVERASIASTTLNGTF